MPVSSLLGCGTRRFTSPTGAVVRAEVRRQLARRHLEGVCEDALLVVTELLSNAVRHGEPPWRASIWFFGARSGRCYVRLEVEDAGPGIDVDRVRAHWRHPSFTLDGGGRGLFLVDGIARSWGDRPSRGGHTVWAELEIPPYVPSPAAKRC
ncbi:ATP-binding protein [Streptomyces sp. NPDC054887]